jgi:hypothetical protein
VNSFPLKINRIFAMWIAFRTINHFSSLLAFFQV